MGRGGKVPPRRQAGGLPPQSGFQNAPLNPIVHPPWYFPLWRPKRTARGVPYPERLGKRACVEPLNRAVVTHTLHRNRYASRLDESAGIGRDTGCTDYQINEARWI